MDNKFTIVSEKVGKNLTRRKRSDYEEVVLKFKTFAHFSQFTNVDQRTNKLPSSVPVRIETSPTPIAGEIVFGIDDNANMHWLIELIDSSD